jgi:hypothetical protein
VKRVDPTLVNVELCTLDEFRQRTPAIAERRLLCRCCSRLPCLAVAAIGIYGVSVYAVEARRHEIGISLALGLPTSRALGSRCDATSAALAGCDRRRAARAAACRASRELLYDTASVRSAHARAGSRGATALGASRSRPSDAQTLVDSGDPDARGLAAGVRVQGSRPEPRNVLPRSRRTSGRARWRRQRPMCRRPLSRRLQSWPRLRKQAPPASGPGLLQLEPIDRHPAPGGVAVERMRSRSSRSRSCQSAGACPRPGSLPTPAAVGNVSSQQHDRHIHGR